MILCYTTTNNKEEAREIAKTLVREKLVACVNIIDNMESVYQWQGEVCVDKEFVLLLKTKKELFTSVESRIKELHSYETPCLFSIQVDQLEGNYYSWINSCLI